MKQCCLLLVGLLGFLLSNAQSLYEAKKDTSKPSRQPYLRYFTKDKLGRIITFYVSESKTTEKLPLLVYVHGSGAFSHFTLRDSLITPRNGHIYIEQAARQKARLVIVEKPGVRYLMDPAPGTLATYKDFNKEHSLDKWVTAIEAAIMASLRAGLADSSKVCVIGHSEGGLVACAVANRLGSLVTHVAVMAGGGNSQLYDILTLARKGNYFANISDDPEKRAAYVLDEWKKIQTDPLSTEKFFFGHSYFRWSSFLKTSPVQELENVNARIFIAQGLKDEAVDYSSADHLYAYLMSKNKDVTYDRLPDADHGYNDKSKTNFNGWRVEMEKVIAWFLGL